MKIDFSKALEAVKTGKKIARYGWNGKSMWVRLFTKNELPAPCALSHSFLVIEYPKDHPAYPEGSCIPWLASQSDILAADWFIID
jgi:hypothetical protein